MAELLLSGGRFWAVLVVVAVLGALCCVGTFLQHSRPDTNSELKIFDPDCKRDGWLEESNPFKCVAISWQAPGAHLARGRAGARALLEPRGRAALQ